MCGSPTGTIKTGSPLRTCALWSRRTSHQTILIDSISIRKSTFSREMDMSRDPKMYSFSNKDGLYKIVLTFNARTTSPHIQDFSGWSGEGLTERQPRPRSMSISTADLTGDQI